jgi:hypothetical protein
MGNILKLKNNVMNNFEKKITEDKLINLVEENDILLNKIINKDYLKAFNYWFDYGAASTVGFLIRKLKLIKSILDNGSSITIEEDPILILNTQEDLKNWIKNRFDESLIEDVYKE